MAKGKSEVQINYRSGSSVTVMCDSFAVERNNATGHLKIEWENAVPRPLLMGVDDIESVWELR